VRQALRLNGNLQAFADRTAAMDPTQFARAYRDFVVSVQNCLGSTGLDPYIVDWEELLFPGKTRPEDIAVRGLHTPVSVGPVTSDVPAA